MKRVLNKLVNAVYQGQLETLSEGHFLSNMYVYKTCKEPVTGYFEVFICDESGEVHWADQVKDWTHFYYYQYVEYRQPPNISVLHYDTENWDEQNESGIVWMLGGISNPL